MKNNALIILFTFLPIVLFSQLATSEVNTEVIINQNTKLLEVSNVFTVPNLQKDSLYIRIVDWFKLSPDHIVDIVIRCRDSSKIEGRYIFSCKFKSFGPEKHAMVIGDMRVLIKDNSYKMILTSLRMFDYSRVKVEDVILEKDLSYKKQYRKFPEHLLEKTDDLFKSLNDFVLNPPNLRYHNDDADFFKNE